MTKEARLTIPEMERTLRGMGCNDKIGDVRLRAYVSLLTAQLEKAIPIIREDERKQWYIKLTERIEQLSPIDNNNLTAVRYIDFEAGFKQAKHFTFCAIEALKQGKAPSQEGGE